LRRAIFVSGLGVGLLRLAGMGLGLLVTIVVGRSLGPAGLGVYGYVVIVLTLLTVPVSYGWGALLLRRVSAARHERLWGEPAGMFVRGTQIAAVLALIVFVAGVALRAVDAALLPAFPSWYVVAVLAAVLFLDQFSALRLAVLRGLDHPLWGQLPEMVLRPALICGIFGIAVAMLGPAVRLEHAFWAMGAAAAVSAVAGAAILRRKRPEAFATAKPVFDTRQWAASALLLAANSGLLVLNSYVDVLLLGAFGTMEQVGVYRIATQVALLSGFAYTALNMLAVPRFSYLRASGSPGELQHSAVFMARLALLGTLPLPLVFAFFGPAIVTAVFGASFAAACAPAFPLFAAQVVNAAAGMASSLLIVNRREAHLTRLTGAAVGVNAALCLLLIPRAGAMGAALSSMSASVSWNLAIWWYARRELGIDTSVAGRLSPTAASRERTGTTPR